MHIDDNTRAGMGPEQARREALIKFGGIETARESVRERTRFLVFETSWQDFRYALRGLQLNPGFAVTAILSLALGIGASLAIFTVADNLLLRPLPYPNASRLTMVWEINQRRNFTHNVVSPGNYLDWKQQNAVFESLAAFREYQAILSDGARAEEFGIQSASAELLPMLGIQPARGRFFTAEEDRAGAQVAIISHHLWQSWFGGDENILGRKIQLNARPFAVIGVMPPGFSFNSKVVELWVPLRLNPSENYRKTQGRWMMSAGRLKPRVTLRAAQAEMTAIGQRLSAAYPEFDKNWGVNVEALRDSQVGEAKMSLLLLLGAV